MFRLATVSGAFLPATDLLFAYFAWRVKCLLASTAKIAHRPPGPV